MKKVWHGVRQVTAALLVLLCVPLLAGGRAHAVEETAQAGNRCDDFILAAPDIFKRRPAEQSMSVHHAPTGHWLGSRSGRRAAQAYVDNKILEQLLSGVSSQPTTRDGSFQVLQRGSAVQIPDSPDAVGAVSMGSNAVAVRTDFFTCGSIIWPTAEIYPESGGQLVGHLTVEVADAGGNRRMIRGVHAQPATQPRFEAECQGGCIRRPMEAIYVPEGERVVRAYLALLPWVSDSTGYNAPDCSLWSALKAGWYAAHGEEMVTCGQTIDFADLIVQGDGLEQPALLVSNAQVAAMGTNWVSLTWSTNLPANAWVVIDGDWFGVEETKHVHSVDVGGLLPGTSYVAEIRSAGSGGQAVTAVSFRTPRR